MKCLKRMLFSFAVFLFLRGSPFVAQSLHPMEDPEYLPQVAGGGDFDTLLIITNLTNIVSDASVEFFDDKGLPLVFATSRGLGSTFVINLKEFASEELLLTRQGIIQVGWARVRSTVKIGVSAKFRMYDRDKVISSAGVKSSPPMPAFSVTLDPQNGIALVNPNRNQASVTVRVFDQGKELPELERNFTMDPGAHIAKYFFEPPFNFAGQKGTIIISSIVPLSAVALSFDDKVFSTIPILPAPRRVDSQPVKKISGNTPVGSKLGVVYFYPSDRTPQPNIAERADEGFSVMQDLFNREMPLNGYDAPELLVERDETTHLPNVTFVKGDQPTDYYIKPDDLQNDVFNTFDYAKVSQEIRKLDLAEYSAVVVFVDTFVFRYDGRYPEGLAMCGSVGTTVNVGAAFVSTMYLPFLKRSLFGDKTSIYGLAVSEFGGQKFPGYAEMHGFNGSGAGPGSVEQMADYAFQIFVHELLHAVGNLIHSAAYPGYLYSSALSGSSPTGAFRENGTSQTIILPITADEISMSYSLNPQWLSWVELILRNPRIEVITQELISSNRLHLVVRPQDDELGIKSVVVDTYGAVGPLFYKRLTHTDQGDITIDIPVDHWDIDYGFWVSASNNQGWWSNFVRLAPVVK